MVNTVGHRTTEMALQLGLLYSPAEALKIGLVDQLVREDQVLTTATETMTKWLAIPGILHIILHLKLSTLVILVIFSTCGAATWSAQYVHVYVRLLLPKRFT